jgi:hypothetical protein
MRMHLPRVDRQSARDLTEVIYPASRSSLPLRVNLLLVYQDNLFPRRPMAVVGHVGMIEKVSTTPSARNASSTECPGR